ncbi:MAG: squalene synthase HpnC [Pseudomonadota bacterium]
MNADQSATGFPAETPSGKGAGDENFPVGSFLLPKSLRPHVARYYDFARAIDDVADNPDLPPEVRIERLTRFAQILDGTLPSAPGYEKASRLRETLVERSIPFRHGTDLTVAFIQDAQKNRYASWDELLGYCENSANPVGRFLLDLHGEDPADYPYSDALCTVLQILNHLQDCGDDLAALDRCYIPTDWMAEARTDIDALRAPAMSPALTQVKMRMLDGCDALMADVRRLPKALKSRHLAMESAVIVRLAERLITRLRRADPLASRVALSKTDFARAGVGGAIAGFFGANSLDRDARGSRQPS